MNRRLAVTLLAASVFASAAPVFGASGGPLVEVFKSPYCGCCGAWVEHMKAAGFSVKVTKVNDTTATRKRHGLSDTYGSCHTATVGGYVLEGHVPAAEVKRLLVAKPGCHPPAESSFRWRGSAHSGDGANRANCQQR